MRIKYQLEFEERVSKESIANLTEENLTKIKAGIIDRLDCQIKSSSWEVVGDVKVHMELLEDDE